MEEILNSREVLEKDEGRGRNLGFSSKGQMFIVGAVVFVIGLFLIKNMFSVYSMVEEKRYQESILIDKELKNIAKEYEYITGIASMKGNDSGINYLEDFSLRLRNESDFRIFYVFIYVNITNQKFSSTVGNFLNDNINVTLNSTNTFIFQLNDKTNATREFSASTLTNLTITYKIKNSIVTEKLLVDASKNFTALFYDIMLDENGMVRTKNYYKVIR